MPKLRGHFVKIGNEKLDELQCMLLQSVSTETYIADGLLVKISNAPSSDEFTNYDMDCHGDKYRELHCQFPLSIWTYWKSSVKKITLN